MSDQPACYLMASLNVTCFLIPEPSPARPMRENNGEEGKWDPGPDLSWSTDTIQKKYAGPIRVELKWCSVEQGPCPLLWLAGGHADKDDWARAPRAPGHGE